MRRVWSASLAVTVVVSSQPESVVAQRVAPEVVPLGPATAVSDQTFTLIRGLRELSDGTVLVTDWIEQRIVAVNLASGEVTEIGRQGGGPREFRLAGALIPMPRDSTMMIDPGNNRLIVIGPRLTLDRSISMNAHGERWGMNPQAIDERGYLYFTPSPFAVGTGAPVDSVPIVRWHEGATNSTHVPNVQIKSSTPRPSGPSRQLNIPIVMFAKQDGWTVTSDGWIAVVRSEPYRVDWFGPEGQRVSGSAVAYDPIPVTMEDRRDRVRSFLAGSMMSGRGADGRMGLVPASAQSSDEIDRLARDAAFAAEFPPFVATSVWSDARANVWVQRAGRSNAPVVIDVFDRSMGRVATFSLDPGRQLVGVGISHIYASIVDADDLLRIERYPMRR